MENRTKKLSKVFFLSSIIGSIVLIPVALFTAATIGNPVELLILAVISPIYGFIIFLILLNEAWSTIQDGYSRTTPKLAVGLLFVPFFNLYWIFQTVWGFAKDYNLYIFRHKLAISKLPESMFFVLSILLSFSPVLHTFSSISPRMSIITIIIELITLVIAIFVVNYICNAINSIREQLSILDKFATCIF